MKKILTLVLSAFLCSTVYPQTTEPCLTEIQFKKDAEKDPSMIAKRKQFENDIKNLEPSSERTGTVRIIPVVFHVVHQGGPENISKAQILDQMVSLNKDYRRTNADTSATNAPWKSIGADCEIEFRLAQKDPFGNCTDGIERIYSKLSDNAVNAAKLNPWPRNRYLNVWVVKTINSSSLGGTGIILAYAQFPPPFGGAAATDGVIIRADYVGSIGSAAGNGNNGRTLTHEIGHWLGLTHIWGDDNGACTGDDFVSDTPIQGDQNFGCSVFPHVSCSNGPEGDMFENYMDYTDGQCQNIFTLGQKAVMDYVLSASRTIIWSDSNLVITGTDGTPPTACAPVSEFYCNSNFICAGTSIQLFEDVYNSNTANTYSWNFTGGTPATSTNANPTITYPTAGDYEVSLTVTNAAGSHSKTKTNFIHVVAPAQYAAPFTNDFEPYYAFPNYQEAVINEDHNSTWERVVNTGYSGNASIMLNTFNGNKNGQIDDYLTKPYDFTHLHPPMFLNFQVASALLYAASDNVLKVFVSADCGKSWQMKYNKEGWNLSTTGIYTTSFVPLKTEWRKESVNLLQFNGAHSVRFMFEGITGGGNNIYIDDINVDGAVGMDEAVADNLAFEIVPNPSRAGNSNIRFRLISENFVSLEIYNQLGEKIQTLTNTNLKSGTYNFPLATHLSQGIYFVKLSLGSYNVSKKLVVMD